ncbi:hypothetical protein KP001_21660 [Geomonas subterranea]|uniref:Transporter n=1 Tax=Geomonas subterranea TaxID=2847989 RepID=A0ABX8LN52_9BACT|nr:hypothetical protein [Geomonas subterranea]QXE90945.1 hypothetical protein KP001_21660 [Geomonas subterranea]QXM10968.1 hypothetical protein KP002_07610 [Geomonas subterranea]
MKTILASLTAVVLICVFPVPSSFAGAWTAKKGGFYEKASFNFYYADKSFNPDGNRRDLANRGEFTDYNLTNYFEYGVTDELTAINSLSYKWLENDNDLSRATAHGIGDIDLGARYRLYQSDAVGVISTQLLVKIPGGYGKNDPLPLGNDQYDTEARLLWGRSLYPKLPGYANVELGYRLRAGAPSDEIRYLVEVGFDLGKNLFTRAKLDGIYSMDNGTRVDGSGNPTTTNNFDLGKLDLTLGYQVTPSMGVELGYRPDLYGQNTAAGANYSVGLYFKTP